MRSEKRCRFWLCSSRQWPPLPVRFGACLVAASALCVAQPALADAPYKDDLCRIEGKSCVNAFLGSRPDVFELDAAGDPSNPGLCVDAKCAMLLEGNKVMIRDCLRCIDKSGVSGATGAGGTGGGDADEGGCSCRVRGPSIPNALSAAMLLVGFVALAWSRRRSR